MTIGDRLKNIIESDFQGAKCQDEHIGVKPPVVKLHFLTAVSCFHLHSVSNLTVLQKDTKFFLTHAKRIRIYKLQNITKVRKKTFSTRKRQSTGMSTEKFTTHKKVKHGKYKTLNVAAVRLTAVKLKKRHDIRVRFLLSYFLVKFLVF
jgi:hypothetical protein